MLKRLWAIAIGIAFLLGIATPSGQAAEPKNLQVMSWNMCGSQRDSWGCAGTGTPEQKTEVVVQHVEHDYVQAALLQEICEDDLTLLMGKLGSGWSKSFVPYRWGQEGVTWNSRCGNDGAGDRADRIGTAIVVKAGMKDARQYAITEPWTGQQQPFHCATATYWDVTLCAVHASLREANPEHPDWDYRDDQMKDIQSVVTSFPHVVFGGDFNSLPPDWPGNATAWVWPADLYSKGPGTPGFQECDQQDATRTGRATHDGGWKLDYLFSSEERRWCGLGDSAYSDHHVLIESVAVR